MSSISVRFNSFSVLYSIFNEHKSPLLGFYPSGFEVPAFRCTSPSFGRGNLPLVGLDGLEPSTSRLSGVRSNHLSYRPLLWSLVFLLITVSLLSKVVEMRGIEPLTPCLQSRCSPS